MPTYLPTCQHTYLADILHTYVEQPLLLPLGFTPDKYITTPPLSALAFSRRRSISSSPVALEVPARSPPVEFHRCL